VKSILTAPDGIALVVVKVETDVPGLYGLGCATFTQRATVVASAVDEYLDPLLRGRNAANIEDLWQMMRVNSSWRNDPVLNNALSGLDMALWDLKGKEVGKPVYDLIGGKCREAAMVYRHADGRDPQQVLENVIRYREEGALAVRCQMGGYGGRVKDITKWKSDPAAAPVKRGALERSASAFPGVYYDPDVYARSVEALFDHVRAAIGFDLFLLHDIHERLAPIDSIRMARTRTSVTGREWWSDGFPLADIPAECAAHGQSGEAFTSEGAKAQ